MGLLTPSDSASYWFNTSKSNKPSSNDDYFFVRPATSTTTSSSHRSSHRQRSPSRSHHSSSRSHQHHHHHHNSHYTSTSRRRPRDGYIAYLLSKLRRLWRYCIRYARRHPVKLFFLVIMPLLSGGMLTGLLKKFGISLPVAVTRFASGMAGGSSGGGGGGYYGSKGYGVEDLVGGGMIGQGLGALGGVGGMMKLASKFM